METKPCKSVLSSIFVFILLLVMFFVSIPDTVRAPQDGDFSYSVSADGKATITDYTGASGVITINSTLGGYPTVAIGNYAFYGYSSLTAVTIPDSVTTIGNSAFHSCTSLTSVTIPNSVTAIGNSAFYSCTSLTSVTIPSSVTTIGVYAFRSCSSLTVINVDETNVNYASVDGVLYDNAITTLIQCPAEKAGMVNIPDTVATIGKAAFLSCTSLTSVIIPSSVDSIGDYAFSYCPLTSVSIPNSVITIGVHAFSSCPLTSVIIGNSVTAIGNYAFSSCTSLTSITFLGLVVPYTVGEYWIESTPVTIRGHAYATSNFPAPGDIFNSLTMGAYISEYPPVFGAPSPVNGSTGNSLSFSWHIPINDPEGDSFNWVIQCSNRQSANANGASNATKSLSLTGLAYSTTYTMWVNATDPTGSGLYTRRWYRFTTRGSGNNPPVFLQAPSPVNGSTGNLLNLTWSIPINDLEGDQFSWTIQCSNGQTNSGTGQTNGTKSLALSGLSYSTMYKVWVNATDPTGSGIYTHKWYTFTTKSSNNGGGGGGGGGSSTDENNKPVADASAGEPYQGFVNAEITFDGSKSSDSDGNITRWLWVFGDNTNGSGKIIRHSYSTAETYTVSLTVTDNEGATSTDTTTCAISQSNNRPPTTPIISGLTNGTKNTMYPYIAVSTDPDNDTIQYTFEWGEPVSLSQSSDFLPNGTSFIVHHSWAAAGRYDVIVTATDNYTESSSNITVYIDAEQTGDIGYLVDNDGDGIYDAFYSDVSKNITVVQKKNGTYTIDSDGNGDWDYTFDAIHGLTSYQAPSKTPGFELVVILCAITVAIFLKRKKRIV
jgi:BspA type Leucine rich repeat region (6 copies)/PKD domain/Fibronectin type III domain